MKRMIWTTVYPRWRGEHNGFALSATLRGGLSPLARGTQISRSVADSTFRFIPAGAGNTGRGGSPSRRLPVYPRRRGEHPAGMGQDNLCCGLSPQARGTPYLRLAVNIWRRFIPAGAGNTPKSNRQRNLRPVYPRRRGEHAASVPFIQVSAGLSPQARGTQWIRSSRRPKRGLSPQARGTHP